MTDLSQGNISVYLRGKHVSEKVRNLIYLWNLKCRSNPERLMKFMNIIDEKEFFEDFFHIYPHPNWEKRELIAEACNIRLSTFVGRKLSKKETVTPRSIEKWFLNTRQQRGKTSLEKEYNEEFEEFS
ncbi:Homeobox domain-containing protein-like protein, partial [Dinothrombium tinctorium]